MDQEERVKSLDAEIARITKSTRTTVPAILSLHDILRQKYSWYYKWHLNPYASKVHTAILSLILIIGLSIGSISIFGLPHFAKAATTTCTWNNGGGTASWNTATNWSCGNVPNNTNDVVLDATSNTAITIDVAATAASFTINTGYTSTVTANYGLTLDTSQGGTGSFTIGAAATYVANATTITVPGNWVSTATGAAFTYGTSTVDFTGAAPSISLNTADAGRSFYHIKTITAGQTVAISQVIKIYGTYYFGSTSGNKVTLNATAGQYLYFYSTTPVAFNGTYNANPGYAYNFGQYFRFYAPGNIALPAQTYDRVQFYPTDNYTMTLQGNTVFVAGLEVGASVAGKTATLELNGYNITGDSTWLKVAVGLTWGSTYNGVIQNTGGAKSTFTCQRMVVNAGSGGNKILANGAQTIDFSISENWTNNDTFTAGASTVTFIGHPTVKQVITTNGQAFNNVVINNDEATYTDITISGLLDINGSFTLTDGNLDLSTNNPNMTVAGDFSIGSNGVMTRGSGTLTFDGTSTVSNATSASLGAVAISGTATLGSSLTMTSNSGAGTLNLGAGSYTLTLTGTGTPLAVTTFQKGTGSTVLHTGTTTATVVAAKQYNNLTITPTATTAYSLAGHLNAAGSTNMTGNLTINNYATLTTTASNYNIDCVNLTIATGGTLTANASTITLSGNWDSSLGTVSVGTSTVAITGTSNITTKNWTDTFYNLQTAYTGQTATWLNNGTITHQLILNGNATGSFTSTNPAGPALSGNGSGYDLITTSGATLASSTKILFTGANAIIPATVTYPNVDFASANTTQTLSGNISSGNIRIFDATSNTATLDLNGKTLTTTGNIDVGYSTDRYGKIVNSSQTTDSTISLTGNLTVVDSTVAGSNILDASGSGGAPKTININIGGNWANNETFTAGTSTVNFNKSSSTQTLNSGGTGAGKLFNNVTHFSSGAGTLQLSTNALDVNGTFTNSAGTFDANNLNVNVAGNFNISGGSFSPKVGGGATTQTVTLDGAGGSTQAIFGSILFHNLTATTAAARTIQFAYYSTTTVANTLTMNGAAGQLLSLRSSLSGTAWLFSVTNAPTLTYVDAQDSNAGSGALITANTSNDSGNNTNWTFGSGVTYISGTVYTNENKSTNVGAGITVAVSVNGGAKSTTTTIAGGVFSFNSVGVAANNTLTFFTDDVTYKSNLVTQVLNTTNDITGLEMYTDDIALRHETAGPMTNTLLATAATLGDSNMFFTSVAGVASFSKKLWIESGFNYSPGSGPSTSTVINNGIEVRGTATFAPGAKPVSVSDNWTMSATGTFTTSGTVTFDKGSSTQTLVSGGKAFSSLTHSGAGALQLVTNDLDTNGTFTNSAGTFDSNNLNMTFAGDWNNTGSAAFTRGSGTLTFDGTSTVTNSSSAAASLAAVAISGTATLGSDLTMTSNSGAGTLNLGAGSYTLTLSGTGTPLGVTTFQKGTGSTVNYIGYTTATTVATVAYNNLLINPAFSATTTYSLAGALSGGTAMTGDLTIYSGATLTTTGSNYNLDCVNFTNNGVLTANGSTLSVAGNWTNTGTLTPGTSTVNLTGADASTQIVTGNTTFNNLSITTTANTAGRTVNFRTGSTQTIGGTITLAGAVGKILTLGRDGGTGVELWTLTLPADYNPSGNYITVSNSDVTTPYKITPGTNCTDGGNNPGWIFNTAPTNDSLTFTNPYSGTVKTAVADDTTEWNFEAKVSDIDGPANINYVEMRLANSTDSTTPYDSLKFRWTEATDAFSETADTQTAATITSTGADSSSSVNQWTLNFKIKFNNSFLAKDTEYAVELYALDDASGSDLDNYATLYQVTATSISLGVGSGTVAFGSLTPGTAVTGTTLTTVTTNYPAGYTLLAQDDVTGSNSALLHTDTTTYIVDNAGTITTPTTWVTNPLGLGICVFQATNKEAKWGTGTTEIDSNNKYAGVPETGTTIHSKTGSPTSGDQTYIGYKLDVLNSQKTGNYAGTVTYTATGVLN